MKLDSPELELLLICLHRTLSEPQRHRAVNLLEAGIDLEKLNELAAQHALQMVLYRGLLQLRLESLMPLIRRLENMMTSEALFYELVFPQQLAAVVGAFEQAGISTLVLKGYVLGQLVYEQPVLRPYGDFDILVPQQYLEQAEACLQQLGYQPDESEHPRSWYYENAYYHHIVPYAHPEYRPVEVHRYLTYNRYGTDVRIDLEDVWRRALPFSIQGVQTRILCPEHHLLYICLHTINTHLFIMGVKPLCDVYHVLLRYGDRLDWSQVIQTARDWNCERQIYLVLRLVNSIFEIALPQLKQFDSTGFDPLFTHYSLSNVFGTTRISWDLARALQEREAGYIGRQIRLSLFPSRMKLVEHYALQPDDPRVWLYYPVWQAARISSIARSLWKLLRRDQAAVALAEQELTRRNLLRWLGEQ